MLGAYCRHQLESGDGQALADLGDLLWHDEPDPARTTFERAIDAGNRRAPISLATYRRLESGDYEGALALYQQAAASPDPGVAAGAFAKKGGALRQHGHYQAARAAWEPCIHDTEEAVENPKRPEPQSVPANDRHIAEQFLRSGSDDQHGRQADQRPGRTGRDQASDPARDARTDEGTTNEADERTRASQQPPAGNHGLPPGLPVPSGRGREGHRS